MEIIKMFMYVFGLAFVLFNALWFGVKRKIEQ